MSKTMAAQHSEWLSLVEISGPFLTLPVLKRALPMGPDPTPLPLVDDLRVAWSEFGDDPTLAPRWVRWVLSSLLELPDEVVKEGTDIGPALTYTVPEHGVRLRPDFIVIDPDPTEGAAPARLLITTLPPGAELDARPDDSKWSADAVERMAELCRGTGVRLGLVTNGDQWAIVDAPVGGATGVAMWDASLWLEERLTLDAFTTLLGVRRFFSVEDTDTLEAMLAESANAEAEVTDQLGKQVRAAVELLVDAMSRANRDQRGQLFADLSGVQVYEAAVTVMMRLVFLLSAEERGLFLLGDETYDSTYAVSTLRAQLEDEADTYGEEVIARRTDAWHRLLATFRMVYAGAEHENLRLPAYGGSLFDPDRFPFLEGRAEGDSWEDVSSNPVPIDNRTVRHILGALQVLRFKDRGGVTEARRLSFRALDVEQIGHVYEGLLDHSAMRVDYPAVGLTGKNEPEIALELIEATADEGEDHLVAYLHQETGLSEKAVAKALAVEPTANDLERLTSACDNDPDLADRIAPYLGLIRRDLADLPTVYLPDSMYVTQSSDRRSSGTYYTPRVLAEEMVLHTLEPLVYSPGPAEGAERDDWKLKSSRELLELKICDMAMGSGAFLVASCRYLSARLLEAWDVEELGAGDQVPLPGDGSTAMPVDGVDREILAKRIVADSCLYGVDRNPMAVEMAKLSIWLITLAKDQPFTFVDHSLRCGDSLLGLVSISQLEGLHLDIEEGRRIHSSTLFDPATRLRPLIQSALEKRQLLESFPVLQQSDAEKKEALLAEATAVLAELKTIGDLVIGAALSTAGQPRSVTDSRLVGIAADVSILLDAGTSARNRDQHLRELRLQSEYWLDEGRPATAPDRRCLHWPLEFPEVYLRPSAGFDALVGNPPFVRGTDLRPVLGIELRDFLVEWIAGGVRGVRGQADLCVYFLLRASTLSRRIIGLVATNSVADGDSQEVGLAQIVGKREWSLYRTVPATKWPSAAQVYVALVWMGCAWEGPNHIDGVEVPAIGADLTVAYDEDAWTPQPIKHTFRQFPGSKVNGVGFYLSNEEAAEVVARFPEEAQCVRPLIIGEDLTESPTQSARASIIFFGEQTLDEASQYPHLLALVDERVRRPREAKGSAGWRKRMVERWWQYEAVRQELYDAISGLKQVAAITRTSNTCVPVLVSPDNVFTEGVIVFATESWFDFGVLASACHTEWAFKYGSAMKADLRYVATRCFECLPFPDVPERGLVLQVEECTQVLHRFRSQAMRESGMGVTALYNEVNRSENPSSEIARVRELHVDLDYAVVAAYGWSDIALEHGLHVTRHGRRFCVSRAASIELIGRLLALNKRLVVEEAPTRGSRSSGRRSGANRQIVLGDGGREASQSA